jgi:ribonuclease HII
LLDQGYRQPAGVDEAGRGPLAGPVVAAVVVLPAQWIRGGMPPDLIGLNDSKQLTAPQREHYFARLTADPLVRFGIGEVTAEVIDTINILQATLQAMRRALAELEVTPDHLLVDGGCGLAGAIPSSAVVRGDALSYSIAAASVLAKVTRDRLMVKYDRRWPQYGFAIHKGYGTPAHLAALREFGPSPIHRRSFAPLRPAERELFELA